MDAEAVLKVDLGSKVGESARGAFFGVINTGFAIRITEKTPEVGGIGVGAIEACVRTLIGSEDKEMIDVAGILFASCT